MPYRVVTITTGETEIAGDNRKRRTLTFTNNGGATFFFSQDRANILTQGFPCSNGQIVTLSTADGDEPDLPLYGQVSAGTVDVRVVESVGEPQPSPVKQVG